MIGRLLRPVRSGPRRLASNDARLTSPATLDVRSPDFAANATMPAAYRGPKSIMPPLVWSEVPPSAKALVLVVEDIDVPFPAPLVHLIAYAIPVRTTHFAAGEIPRFPLRSPARAAGVALGKSAGLAPGFLPVTPIPGHGPHRYVFQVFALDTELAPFSRAPSKKQLVAAMAGHVIAHGTTTGLAEG